MQKNKPKKKIDSYENYYSRWLPLFYGILSLLIIILPLQRPVNSARAVLSYVFIPQLRAAHAVKQYLNGVSEAVDVLVSTAAENLELKEEIARLKIENAQALVLERENLRLASAMDIKSQTKWAGVWAKVAYREPSRRSTIMVDKGANDGVQLRAPVIGVDESAVGLLGKVIEVTPKTAKILLSTDEEFFVTAFLSQTRIEGLAAGNSRGGMFVKYIPLETNLTDGELVYTSASSAIFPDGILIGALQARGAQEAQNSFLTPPLKPAVDPLKIKEVFILAPQGGGR